MRISICFGLALLFLNISASSVWAETPPEHSEIATRLFDSLTAIIGGERLQAFVDDEALRKLICPNGDSPCTVYFKELLEKKYTQCSSKDDYIYIHEIDCGADGNPDLLIEYRGVCFSHISNRNRSGIYYLTYHDDNKKYHIAQIVEYWKKTVIRN